MINLLPLQERIAILFKRRGKIIIILWFLVLFFSLCFILILFSIKIYLQDQIEYQDIILKGIEKEAKDLGVQDLQQEINSVNESLISLQGFYEEEVYIVNILEKISKLLPQGIYLNDISVTSSDNRNSKINFSGFTLNRDILLNFKENLEKEKSFKDIYFPSSNWVKATNIDFYVTLESDNNF